MAYSKSSFIAVYLTASLAVSLAVSLSLASSVSLAFAVSLACKDLFSTVF